MNSFIRFALILFLVNLIAASILAGVYTITKAKIDAQKRLIEQQSLKEVMPESVGDRLERGEAKGLAYWKVYKKGRSRPEGYIFIAKRYGYSSEIETMVGIKKDGTITGVRVLSHNETPGLGAKIVEVVSDRTIWKAIKDIFSKEKKAGERLFPYFTEQFKGHNVKRLKMSDIDAITGATITSKAVVEAIKEKGIEVLSK